MDRFKAWAIDIGLWEAATTKDWQWRRFRPRFWETPTNKRNRELAESVLNILRSYATDVGKSYEQGKRDGRTQVLDELEGSLNPDKASQRYIN